MNLHTTYCRHCDHTGHRVSRVRLFEWPLYALGFVPIRCKSCRVRAYRHRLASDKPDARGRDAKLD